MTAPILVVDDDEDLRETLRLALEMEGFEVSTAANGREALDKLEPPPALVLLDLRMPVMDGWQTIEALREMGHVGRLPILSCTSAAKDAPDGFPILEKPVELDALLERIRTALSR